LNVCFGPGAIPTDMEIYGVQPADAGSRVAEAIDMILALWECDGPVELAGKFWNIQMRAGIDPQFGLGVLAKPLQQPHPPIYVPTISRRSEGLKKAAERSFRPISHHMLHYGVLADQWSTYREGAQRAGRAANPADWCVSRNVFVADSTQDARKLARGNSLGACIQYILDLTDSTAPTGRRMWKRDDAQSDAECNLDYFMDQVIIAGDPEHVTRELLELRERIGPFGTLVLVAHDWDDRRQWLHHLELFAHEVLPRFNRAIGAVA
jgi:alkanesulfonate monooxygenase SsuD/methylene tetrahydromethanopterin reductase-like flavin-dependent oxidoreductase (luciferase family)